jgi:hypothetical protein
LKILKFFKPGTPKIRTAGYITSVGWLSLFKKIMMPTESGFHRAVEKLAWSSLNKI